MAVIEKDELYFLNENYNKASDLFKPVHDFCELFIDRTEITCASPLNYLAMETPSIYRKSFYDNDGLLVEQHIYDIFSKHVTQGLYVVPIRIKFIDNIEIDYYRLDTRLEYDLIDYNSSEVDEDGDLESIYLNQEKLNNIPLQQLAFFRLKGLGAEQYLVNQAIQDELSQYSDEVILATEVDYELLW